MAASVAFRACPTNMWTRKMARLLKLSRLAGKQGI
jgi:hypothetical protein